MTEIAVAPKLSISVTNSGATASLGSQQNIASTLNVTPGCHNSEKSIVAGQLDTTESSVSSSSSLPQRTSVQQQNHPIGGGFTSTCNQNALPFSPQRTASPTNQPTHQHYHHHRNHYHSPHHHHHHSSFPIRQQAAVRNLQEFMLLQWHNFEYRNHHHHQMRSFGNPGTDTKPKSYYSTPRYSQSRKDFQAAAEAKHGLSQGDRNSPVNVSTKGGNQVTLGTAVGETWAAPVPFYRRKLISNSGNLSPTQQQSLRHSGSVDTVTWQRGYSTFQKNYNNNSTRLPPIDPVCTSGARSTPPIRGHSVGSSSSSSSVSSGSTTGSACTPSPACTSSSVGTGTTSSSTTVTATSSDAAGAGDQVTIIDAPQQQQNQVPHASARKVRHGEVAHRALAAVGQTILSRRPPTDQQQHQHHRGTNEGKATQPLSARTEEPVVITDGDAHSPSNGERPSPVITEAEGDQSATSSPPIACAKTPSPLLVGRRPGELVASGNNNNKTVKPNEDSTEPKRVEGNPSPSPIVPRSSWQPDLPNDPCCTGEDASLLLLVGRSGDEADNPGCAGVGAFCQPATAAVDGYVTASSDQSPPANLPVAISVNTVSSSVSSGDGLTGGEHYWTPDPPASPASNTVATGHEG